MAACGFPKATHYPQSNRISVVSMKTDFAFHFSGTPVTKSSEKRVCAQCEILEKSTNCTNTSRDQFTPHGITNRELLPLVLRTVCAMATGHHKLSMCHTAHLGRQCCLLSSSPGPSSNPLLDFLCWAAVAVAAPAVGCLPARTDRSLPWGPRPQLGPERSLAVWNPSSSQLVAVPMRHSKNVPPGREMQACDWGETRRRRVGGREGDTSHGCRSGCAKKHTETIPEIGRYEFQNNVYYVVSIKPFSPICVFITFDFNLHFSVKN